VTIDLSRIRALTFDVGGTVFDWQSTIIGAVGELAQAKGASVDAEAFARTWRAAMFGHLVAMNKGEAEVMNADGMHRKALDGMDEAFADLALSPTEKDDLTRAWHRMPAWPGVPEAIAALRQRYVVSILSILSVPILVGSSRTAGIDWDLILSCEFLPAYKPEPESYQGAVGLLAMQPDQVMMVAAHPFDLRGARAAGLRTANLQPNLSEPNEFLPPESEPGEFDIEAENFADLVRQLCP
jgi:2-haloacid dehalogenase